jgi:DNA-binding transcriptional MerR regulator
MDRDFLKRCLDEGMSLPQIGALVNRDPSTVGYWVQKHGLVANGRAKYSPRGGLKRERLEALVEERLSVREMAEKLDVSASTVRHWLKRYGLPTDGAYRRRQRRIAEARLAGVRSVMMDCRHHGRTEFVILRSGEARCRKCRADAVARRRRKVKQMLVDEHGGKCQLCGFDRHVAALEFHHRDPEQKSFGLARRGVTRAIEKVREEAAKCILLCSNCHALVEVGAVTLPARR